MVLLSFGLGLGGLYLVGGQVVFRPETYRPENLSFPLLLLGAAAFLSKWLFPPVRIWLLCLTQKVPLPYRSALLAHLAAMFVAAFTPNNTGVAPATVVALNRLGVPPGRGIGVAVQLFVLDLIFFAWSVPLGVAYLSYADTIQLPPNITLAALAIAVLTIAGAIVLIRYPRIVAWVLLLAASWPILSRFASRLRQSARDYYRSMKAFKRAKAPMWIALNASTVAQWFGSFVLFWSLLGLYGVKTNPLTILATLSALTLISHLIPTPGAAGFMEAAVGLSLGGQIGGVAAAVLIWRFASFYVIFIVGPLAGWLLHLTLPTSAQQDEASGATPGYRHRSYQ
jgi:uncharacterized protein (TIRG00374 family)